MPAVTIGLPALYALGFMKELPRMNELLCMNESSAEKDCARINE